MVFPTSVHPCVCHVHLSHEMPHPSKVQASHPQVLLDNTCKLRSELFTSVFTGEDIIGHITVYELTFEESESEESKQKAVRRDAVQGRPNRQNKNCQIAGSA